ncbi:hypothetical protein L1887_35684 [Cichorium endivia]|nr:hypothetical protein L1887_35684 [Cichorium endivia]
MEMDLDEEFCAKVEDTSFSDTEVRSTSFDGTEVGDSSFRGLIVFTIFLTNTGFTGVAAALGGTFRQLVVCRCAVGAVVTHGFGKSYFKMFCVIALAYFFCTEESGDSGTEGISIAAPTFGTEESKDFSAKVTPLWFLDM